MSFCFLLTSYDLQLTAVHAQEIHLPAPGVMVHLSPDFNPPVLKGVTVDPQNPFKFDFILDVGDGPRAVPVKGDRRGAPLQEESAKLVKYFLASITTPERDLWVNLSPYEKNRIIPDSFGQTDMGRDLLAQDYILKQVTSSLIYPEDEFGKKFWKRVYEEAAKKFGTTNIPVNTFNKVWIVPDKAKVYEHGNGSASSPQVTAFVVKARLKVMLEEDYLSQQKHNVETRFIASSKRDAINLPAGRQVTVSTNQIGSQIIRQIVIPQLEKEVNEGKNFAPLRQVYNSLILAVWFKKRMKDSILGRKYMDQNKIANLSSPNASIGDPESIYQRYLQAFKKGVYNYIKEEPDPITNQMTPRKYFSGGAQMYDAMMKTEISDKMLDSEKSALNGDFASVSVLLRNFMQNLIGRTKNPIPDEVAFSIISKKFQPAEVEKKREEGIEIYDVPTAGFLLIKSKGSPFAIKTQYVSACTAIGIRIKNGTDSYYGVAHIYNAHAQYRESLSDQVRLIHEFLIRKAGFQAKNIEYIVDYRVEEYMKGVLGSGSKEGFIKEEAGKQENSIRQKSEGARFDFHRRSLSSSKITGASASNFVMGNITLDPQGMAIKAHESSKNIPIMVPWDNSQLSQGSDSAMEAKPKLEWASSKEGIPIAYIRDAEVNKASDLLAQDMQFSPVQIQFPENTTLPRFSISLSQELNTISMGISTNRKKDSYEVHHDELDGELKKTRSNQIFWKGAFEIDSGEQAHIRDVTFTPTDQDRDNKDQLRKEYLVIFQIMYKALIKRYGHEVADSIKVYVPLSLWKDVAHLRATTYMDFKEMDKIFKEAQLIRNDEEMQATPTKISTRNFIKTSILGAIGYGLMLNQAEAKSFDEELLSLIKTNNLGEVEKLLARKQIEFLTSEGIDVFKRNDFLRSLNRKLAKQGFVLVANRWGFQLLSIKGKEIPMGLNPVEVTIGEDLLLEDIAVSPYDERTALVLLNLNSKTFLFRVSLEEGMAQAMVGLLKEVLADSKDKKRLLFFHAIFSEIWGQFIMQEEIVRVSENTLKRKFNKTNVEEATQSAPILYTVYLLNKELRKLGLLVTHDTHLVSIKDTNDGVDIVEPVEDNNDGKDGVLFFMGFTSPEGESLVNLQNTYRFIDSPLSYLPEEARVINEGLDTIIRKRTNAKTRHAMAERVFPEHERSHRKRNLKIRERLGLPDHLSYQQYVQLMGETIQNHLLDEMLARMGELNRAVERNQMDDVWFSLLNLCYVKPRVVNSMGILGFLANTPEAQSRIKDLKRALYVNPSQGRVLRSKVDAQAVVRLIEKQFDTKALVDSWVNILDGEYEKNNQTPYMTERIKEVYQLLYDAWDALEGVTSTTEDRAMDATEQGDNAGISRDLDRFWRTPLAILPKTISLEQIREMIVKDFKQNEDFSKYSDSIGEIVIEGSEKNEIMLPTVVAHQALIFTLIEILKNVFDHRSDPNQKINIGVRFDEQQNINISIRHKGEIPLVTLRKRLKDAVSNKDAFINSQGQLFVINRSHHSAHYFLDLLANWALRMGFLGYRTIKDKNIIDSMFPVGTPQEMELVFVEGLSVDKRPDSLGGEGLGMFQAREKLSYFNATLNIAQTTEDAHKVVITTIQLPADMMMNTEQLKFDLGNNRAGSGFGRTKPNLKPVDEILPVIVEDGNMGIGLSAEKEKFVLMIEDERIKADMQMSGEDNVKFHFFEQNKMDDFIDSMISSGSYSGIWSIDSNQEWIQGILVDVFAEVSHDDLLRTAGNKGWGDNFWLFNKTESLAAKKIRLNKRVYTDKSKEAKEFALFVKHLALKADDKTIINFPRNLFPKGIEDKVAQLLVVSSGEGNSFYLVKDIAEILKDFSLVGKNTGPGGIDLTSDRMNLDVDSDKSALSQPFDLKSLESIEINGLYIQSIELKPLTNLPQLLGVSAP